jgi:hypothetical protein
MGQAGCPCKSRAEEGQVSVGEEEFRGERVEVRVQQLSGGRYVDLSIVDTEVISVNGKRCDCKDREAKNG